MPTPRKKPAAEQARDRSEAAKPKKAAAHARRSAAPARQWRTPRPAGGGAFDLVVVESPAKAKTINKYLGPSYRVLASYGHVRDLDTRKKKGEEVAGIDIADGWKLRYVVDDGSEDEGRRAAAADARRTSSTRSGARPRRPTASTWPPTPTARARRSPGTSPRN